MACVSPPELSDSQLLAFVDGESDGAVAAHLAQCAHCRGRAAALARLQGRITARLYRLACPTPQELGEHQMGLLPRPQAEAIALHLAECPPCRAEVAQLETFLADTARDLDLSVVERVRVLVGRLIGGGPGMPALAPALPGLRGGAAGPAVYEAGEVQITIEALPLDEAAEQHDLLGLVTGAAGALHIQLYRGEQLVAEAPVDEAGNFVLGGLDPGAYTLVASGPELEIRLEQVRIG